MKLDIPASLLREHEQLQEELVNAGKVGGKTGEVARELTALMEPHFQKEEKYALPPLGVLTVVASGEVTPEMREIVAITDGLREHLGHIQDEHESLDVLLIQLTKAATEENHPSVLRLVERLMLHSKIEDEVVFPAAVLVGEHIRRVLGNR